MQSSQLEKLVNSPTQPWEQKIRWTTWVSRLLILQSKQCHLNVKSTAAPGKKDQGILNDDQRSNKVMPFEFNPDESSLSIEAKLRKSKSIYFL